MIEDATLAILAGGEGSRMGRPKAELVVAGKPILGYLLDRIAWPGSTLLVTAPGRERPPAWERFDREVSDPVAGQGPLRGVLTALESCETEIVAIATVDMPEIGRDVLDWLVDQVVSRKAVGVMCERERGRMEPFPCVFCQGAVDHVREMMATGERSVHSMTDKVGVITLAVPREWPETIWTNLNRPEDFAAWLSR